jgi:hypothetical protein
VLRFVRFLLADLGLFRPLLQSARRLSMLLVAVFCINAVHINAATAQSLECRSLRNAISAATQGGGGASKKPSAQAGKYADAIAAQKQQMAKARSQLRSLGCGGGSIITLGGNKGASCQKLNGALRSMQANLTKLESQYKRLSRSGGTAKTSENRSVLLARFKAAGCTLDGKAKALPGVTVARATPDDDRNVAAFFGEAKKKPAKPNDSQDKKKFEDLEIPGLDFAGDTYRTLCVRTCDGYYFPISFSTTKDNFKRDLKACETMCPGTEVQLFKHEVPEQESEDMVSLKGEPYKAMTYAFAYRRDGLRRDEACKCTAVQGMAQLEDLAGTTAKPETDASIANAVPVPRPRADPLAPAGLLHMSAGDLTLEDVSQILDPKSAEFQADDDMRVVGPVYLPDPSSKLNLKQAIRPIFR